MKKSKIIHKLKGALGTQCDCPHKNREAHAEWDLVNCPDCLAIKKQLDTISAVFKEYLNFNVNDNITGALVKQITESMILMAPSLKKEWLRFSTESDTDDSLRLIPSNTYTLMLMDGVIPPNHEELSFCVTYEYNGTVYGFSNNKPKIARKKPIPVKYIEVTFTIKGD